MNAQDLRDAGYRVGLNIADADVSRAETLVVQNYINPITHGQSAQTLTVKNAVRHLVFMALCGENVYATRSGGKMKMSPNLSERGYLSQTDYETADNLLRQCQALQGAEQGQLDRIVNDVLHIYFRSYLSMN